VTRDCHAGICGSRGLKCPRPPDLYAEATRGQDLGSWVTAHMNAWEAYGGVATLVVPDNLKAGVTGVSGGLCKRDPPTKLRGL
jgi:transposase